MDYQNTYRIIKYAGAVENVINYLKGISPGGVYPIFQTTSNLALDDLEEYGRFGLTEKDIPKLKQEIANLKAQAAIQANTPGSFLADYNLKELTDYNASLSRLRSADRAHNILQSSLLMNDNNSFQAGAGNRTFSNDQIINLSRDYRKNVLDKAIKEEQKLKAIHDAEFAKNQEAEVAKNQELEKQLSQRIQSSNAKKITVPAQNSGNIASNVAKSVKENPIVSTIAKSVKERPAISTIARYVKESPIVKNVAKSSPNAAKSTIGWLKRIKSLSPTKNLWSLLVGGSLLGTGLYGANKYFSEDTPIQAPTNYNNELMGAGIGGALGATAGGLLGQGTGAGIGGIAGAGLGYGLSRYL